MCNPAAAAIGIQLGGSVISGLGQKQASEAEAGLLEHNAAVEQVAAGEARKAGEVELRKHRLNVRRFIGTQRSAIASSGLRLDRGIGLQLQEDTARQGELDAIEIENNIRREEWGHMVKAQGYLYHADLKEDEGKFGLIGPILGGAGAALGDID